MERYGMDYLGRRSRYGRGVEHPDWADYGYRGRTMRHGAERGLGGRTTMGRGATYWGQAGYGGYNWGPERGRQMGRYGAGRAMRRGWGTEPGRGMERGWGTERGWGAERGRGMERGTTGWAAGYGAGYRGRWGEMGGYDRDFGDRLRHGWHELKRGARDLFGGEGGYGRTYRGY